VDDEIYFYIDLNLMLVSNEEVLISHIYPTVGQENLFKELKWNRIYLKPGDSKIIGFMSELRDFKRVSQLKNFYIIHPIRGWRWKVPELPSHSILYVSK